jgi:hypothetical protein
VTTEREEARAEVARLRADLATAEEEAAALRRQIGNAETSAENARRVLSGELTKPYPGTLAYEVAQAISNAERNARNRCAKIIDKMAAQKFSCYVATQEKDYLIEKEALGYASRKIMEPHQARMCHLEEQTLESRSARADAEGGAP